MQSDSETDHGDRDDSKKRDGRFLWSSCSHHPGDVRIDSNAEGGDDEEKDEDGQQYSRPLLLLALLLIALYHLIDMCRGIAVVLDEPMFDLVEGQSLADVCLKKSVPVFLHHGGIVEACFFKSYACRSR